MVAKKKVVVKQETDENKAKDLELQDTAEGVAEAATTKEKKKIKVKADEQDAVDPLDEMRAKIEALEQESKETHDRLLRVSAEFENYKKRAAKEIADFRKFANESFAKALLPVVDNLQRAIASSSDDEKTGVSVVEGVTMTLKEVMKVLEQFGVKPFESLGETFDPGFHQAMHQEETDEHPDNTVIREFQKGYMIHDRLLRPAMVVVSKKKTGTADKSEADN
jgi:molecular chaperone GrpE